MVEETSKKVFKQKNSKFEKKNFLTFLSPQGVAQGYPLARPPARNLKIASVRPPNMSKDTFMQNFKPLGLVDVSGDILGFTFWLRSFNYEDSCRRSWPKSGPRRYPTPSGQVGSYAAARSTHGSLPTPLGPLSSLKGLPTPHRHCPRRPLP